MGLLVALKEKNGFLRTATGRRQRLFFYNVAVAWIQVDLRSIIRKHLMGL
jgi:predicted small integral membrane protein